MKPNVYIGIDPGNKGYLCALIPESNKVSFMENNAKPIDIVNWLKSVEKMCNIKVIMIENVHAIQGSSAKSNFSFGFNTGLITGITQTFGIMFDKVNPKAWQKFIGVTKKGLTLKHDVADICERLYPNITIRGPRGGLQDGKSDSLMIAHFAAHKIK